MIFVVALTERAQSHKERLACDSAAPAYTAALSVEQMSDWRDVSGCAGSLKFLNYQKR